MSSSSDFRAVDLDAVLDEFESSQDLVTLQDEQKIESCSMTVADDSNKPNLLEDLQTQVSFVCLCQIVEYVFYILSLCRRIQLKQ